MPSSISYSHGIFSVVTVIDAVSAAIQAILPVWVDFTSLKGLPCAGTGDDPKGHAGGESDLMIECNKLCKDWYHNTCLNLSEREINEILISFCPECKAANPSHKIVRKDYSKEHTKPLFKKYGILSVYNLYPYYNLE